MLVILKHGLAMIRRGTKKRDSIEFSSSKKPVFFRNAYMPTHVQKSWFSS
jgi:hypothetical protein